jgi:PPM family protein phosphatase
MLHFEAATATSQGARRYQEDAAGIFPGARPAASLLAVLADGMGGHAGGATASRLICDTFIAHFIAADADVVGRLGGALDAANAAIARMVNDTPALSGMGSTLIGASFGADGLEWVSVGDSPLYLYRRAEIALLNEDHSLAPALDQLAAAGKITEAEARSDPRRHMLRSAVTGEELDLVDLSRKALVLADDDYVILASDGIHTLEEAEVARIVTGYASAGPQAVADALIRAVLDLKEPHQDNVTIVAVRPSSASAAGDGT